MKHKTKSERRGDWLVYRCGDCSFEFWDNMKTGDTHIKNPDPKINHFGRYVSQSWVESLERQN